MLFMWLMPSFQCPPVCGLCVCVCVCVCVVAAMIMGYITFVYLAYTGLMGCEVTHTHTQHTHAHLRLCTLFSTHPHSHLCRAKTSKTRLCLCVCVCVCVCVPWCPMLQAFWDASFRYFPQEMNSLSVRVLLCFGIYTVVAPFWMILAMNLKPST